MISCFSARRAAVVAGLILATTLSAEAQQPSPRDTVRATIGGANLMIDYGRPAMRGRDIYGALVPWNQPWRTGANQPTTLTTDQPIAFGNTVLPAGTHAIYTVPAPSAWKLIVMKEVPRWGIPYPGEAQDLFRVDMSVGPLSTPVEMLTLKLEPQGEGGVLTVEWDRTRATIPFTVRR
ncbi:MAG TPA: DUF2911 domain-containing protein [Gemmatimonadales bacterium]|nr:DUF2911 domain-containing protein [Gemmatimonadales bacterium]